MPVRLGGTPTVVALFVSCVKPPVLYQPEAYVLLESRNWIWYEPVARPGTLYVPFAAVVPSIMEPLNVLG
jgi:hypothetical protein